MLSITGLPAFVKKFLQSKKSELGGGVHGQGRACASTPFLKEPRALVLLLLPSAVPGRDPFYVEDEEVLEALGRVHSGKVPACANLEKTKSVS